MFLPVCDSVHREGVHPLSLADTPLGQTRPVGRHPSPEQMATAADGTHPTGMHSCSLSVRGLLTL